MNKKKLKMLTPFQLVQLVIVVENRQPNRRPLFYVFDQFASVIVDH